MSTPKETGQTMSMGNPSGIEIMRMDGQDLADISPQNSVSSSPLISHCSIIYQDPSDQHDEP